MQRVITFFFIAPESIWLVKIATVLFEFKKPFKNSSSWGDSHLTLSLDVAMGSDFWQNDQFY